MTTRPRRKKAKAKKAAKKKAARKATAGKKKAALKTRGTKPARRRKKAVARRRSRPAVPVQHGATGRRNLLTSLRRPKAAKPRGSARARVVPRRRPVKRPVVQGAGEAAASQGYLIRDFATQDAAAVNAVALAAFEQYRGEYSDWPEFSKLVGSMANLADDGEVIVALSNDRVVGAVAYSKPGALKPSLADPAWPLIRMLAVDPAERGRGLGRMLAEECIRRARRDGADAIALHMSPIMQVALAMYQRFGFVLLRECPPIFGVPYRIYLKRL